MSERFDVVVIGAGPGGARAARKCRQYGASVAIVEKHYFGGTCLNYGCIPSKALLSSAHTLLAAKHAVQIGIDIASAAPNWPNIQQRKDAIVTGFRNHMAASAEANNITIFRGSASVTAPNTIKIETDEKPAEINADKIIIATGSEPIPIPNIPVDGQTVIGSKQALSLPEIPQSMVIIGGGVIGCEMACIYAAMGTKVTIVEALAQLIPMEGQWVGRLIEREFKKLGIDSLTSCKVTSVENTGASAKVTLEDGQAIDAEKVLVSVGRKPLVNQQTIEALNLQMNGQAISVDEKMQTSVPGVYAIGDAVGTTFLAHGATTEAEVTAANATGGDRTMADYSLIPRVIFTFPEIASVGKSEDTCKSEGLDVSVGKGFFKANGRSVAQNQTAGQIRLVRENATNKILGITMVGQMVTELIIAASMLIGNRKSEIENRNLTFPHPTISETLEDAIEDAFA